MLFRHGDVLAERVESLPEKRRRCKHLILAHGEVTGHSHRIKERNRSRVEKRFTGFDLTGTKIR